MIKILFTNNDLELLIIFTQLHKLIDFSERTAAEDYHAH